MLKTQTTATALTVPAETEEVIGRERSWRLGPVLSQGDSWELHGVEDDPELAVRVFGPGAGALSVRERQTLELLGSVELARPYFPQLVEEVRQKQTEQPVAEQLLYGKEILIDEGVPKALLIRRPKDLLSLEDLSRLFPKGLDPKDTAWIMRRLLMALGFAHDQGLLHTALSGANVFVEPAQHGLLIDGWFSARDWDHPTERSQDLAAGAKLIDELHKERPLPKALRAFLAGCQTEHLAARPEEAFDLKDQFDELIEDLWGRRRFRPLEIPQQALADLNSSDNFTPTVTQTTNERRD